MPQVRLSRVSRPAGRKDPTTDSEGKPLPGTGIPCVPIAEKRQELGCYVIARQRLGALPQETPPAWQLDVFPSRAAAEAAKGQLATIAEVFDRIWLFTIAPPDWRPGAGAEHVACGRPMAADNAIRSGAKEAACCRWLSGASGQRAIMSLGR